MVKKPGSFKKESMKDKKAERQAEYSATLNVPSPPSRNVVADDDDDDDDQSPLRKYPPRNKKVRATFNFKID